MLRLKVFTRRGLLPEGFDKTLAEQAPNFHKWSEAVSKAPSVTGIFDEEVIVAWQKERLAKARV